MPQINKQNLEIALKKSNLNFLEFLNRFIKYHVTKGNNDLDAQDMFVFNWIKNIYNNSQTTYEENTINTLSKVLRVDPNFLIENNEIKNFNDDFKQFLTQRVINFLKTQNKTSIENFKKNINTDINNILEGL